MPFSIRLLGVSGNRATLGIEASYRGAKCNFSQSTYSIVPGQEILISLNVHIEGFGDIPDGNKELEVSGVEIIGEEIKLLYKVEPEGG